ncbi:unnamed protein product [Clavelina lepadiformis]|uniref:Uncharacterized protein n=1 Tax=Clavelina lepadiformis TaxID=159417 RepID=A0ABP0F749_CLALP
MKLVSAVVAAEILGLVAAYSYFKKIESDIDYRKKLYMQESKVLEAFYKSYEYSGNTQLRQKDLHYFAKDH